MDCQDTRKPQYHFTLNILHMSNFLKSIFSKKRFDVCIKGNWPKHLNYTPTFKLVRDDFIHLLMACKT